MTPTKKNLYTSPLLEKAMRPPSTPAGYTFPNLGNLPSATGVGIGPVQGPVRPAAPTLKYTGAVPSTAVTSSLTKGDVMNTRASLEQQRDALQRQLDTMRGISSKIGATTKFTPNPLSNPDEFLARNFNTDKPLSDAQTKEQSYLDTIANKTKDFFGSRSKNIENAYDKFGVSDARDTLAETNKQLAEREVRLRNDLKSLENDSEERGVSREFAIDRRNQVKSEAAFDIANLSIIQSAQLGNLEQARSDAKTVVDQQFEAYETEIAMYEADLKRLAPTLSREQQAEAQQIQIALDERKRMLADAKDMQESKYSYLTEAAKNGAPSSVTNAILAATTVEEAVRLSAPYMGLLDRQKEARIAAGDTESSSFVKLNPEDKKTLQGGGFTQSEIDDIPKVVSEFGIDALLNEYQGQPAKLAAIQKVYNSKDQASGGTFINEDFLTGLFSDDQLKKAASTAGYRSFFSSWATEKKNYLANLMKQVEAYRKAGYTDKEILSKMQ